MKAAVPLHMTSREHTAKELMNPRIFALSPEAPVDEAVQRLLKLGYSGAPVVDEGGVPVGVFSEYDCLAALADERNKRTPGATVKEYMTQELRTVPPGASLSELTARFRRERCRRLIVVDEEGRLAGLITRRDLMRELDAALKPPRVTTYEALQQRWR